jgi:ATP-binding cassette subfamily B protein
MEELAGQLGLQAEQIMMPIDHLLLAQAEALPAIVVVRMPNGLTHFVVVWRRHGPLLQVMDPALGRRWTSCKGFCQEVYEHTLPIAAESWRQWAGSEQFSNPLRWRLDRLGLSAEGVTRLIASASADPGWRTFAMLDAATRMVDAMVESGGIQRGRPSAALLLACFEEARQTPASTIEDIIPSAYWSAQAVPLSPEGEEQVQIRGAVLIRVPGPKEKSLPSDGTANLGSTGQLSPELAAALAEPPSHPARELMRLLRADGLLPPTALVGALVLAAAGVIFEALLFRGLFDLGHEIHLTGERLAAMGVLIVFVLALLCLELPIAASLLRMGRRLEIRLRVAFLEKDSTSY